MILHNSMMRRLMRLHNGYEVKCDGDSFMAVFAHPSDAMKWMLEAQGELLREKWPAELLEHALCAPITSDKQQNPLNEDHEQQDGRLIFRGLSVRMGAHWGSPEFITRQITPGRVDYFGPNVIRAARMESMAQGGQILITQALFEQVRDYLSLAKLDAQGRVVISESGEQDVNFLDETLHDHHLEPIEEEPSSPTTIKARRLGVAFDLGKMDVKGQAPEPHTFAVYPSDLCERHAYFYHS